MTDRLTEAGARWDRAYLDGSSPWDIGRAQPAFLAAAASMRSPVLDAGCGTGENALALAANGLQVVGVDIARRAIAEARRKAAERGIEATFEVGDALSLDALGRRFWVVTDSGLFHTFEPEREQARYVAGLRAVLQPGGTLYLMCFSDREPGSWGPRRITRAELQAAFADGWRADSIEPADFETALPSGPARAWFARLTRLADGT